jgi:hypothetical protein
MNPTAATDTKTHFLILSPTMLDASLLKGFTCGVDCELPAVGVAVAEFPSVSCEKRPPSSVEVAVEAAVEAAVSGLIETDT